MSDGEITYEQLDNLSRVPSSLQDLNNLKKIVTQQKELITELETKVSSLINQLIKIRELMLPKEIDLAKNFYSHVLFDELISEENQLSANAMEVLKKKSN